MAARVPAMQSRARRNAPSACARPAAYSRRTASSGRLEPNAVSNSSRMYGSVTAAISSCTTRAPLRLSISFLSDSQ